MCAAGQCPHERHSCPVEQRCVKISHKLREIFHSGMFERSRSGYCDLKGFQVDLSAQIFGGRLMCFLTGKMFENIFLKPIIGGLHENLMLGEISF